MAYAPAIFQPFSEIFLCSRGGKISGLLEMAVRKRVDAHFEFDRVFSLLEREYFFLLYINVFAEIFLNEIPSLGREMDCI